MGCCASTKPKGNYNNERIIKSLMPATEPGTGGPRGSFIKDNPDDEVIEVSPNAIINPNGSYGRITIDDP